jgi:ribosomal protein S1
VKVVSIDLEREKVGLSMKDCDNSEVVKKVSPFLKGDGEARGIFKNPSSLRDTSFEKGGQEEDDYSI